MIEKVIEDVMEETSLARLPTKPATAVQSAT
jgi:hypothetical protein